MDPVHLHLMLNHLPVVGSLFALGLLVFGVLRSNESLKKAALGAFVIVAVLSIPAYLTGEPSEEIAEKLPGVTDAVIERHEDAAKIAFGLILFVGAVALGGLAVIRAKPVPRWFSMSVVGVSIVAAASLAWTANLGGKVRHTEIRNGHSMDIKVTKK